MGKPRIEIVAQEDDHEREGFMVEAHQIGAAKLKVCLRPSSKPSQKSPGE